jgi:hypothetical protein
MIDYFTVSSSVHTEAHNLARLTYLLDCVISGSHVFEEVETSFLNHYF